MYNNVHVSYRHVHVHHARRQIFRQGLDARASLREQGESWGLCGGCRVGALKRRSSPWQPFSGLEIAHHIV